MKYFNFPKKTSFVNMVSSLFTILNVSLGFSQGKPFMQETSDSYRAILVPTINLRLNNGTQEKSTKIVYSEWATLELDPGYDSGAFPDGLNFGFHSRLLNSPDGLDFAVQALPIIDYNSYSIPLSVYAEGGSSLTFSATGEGDLPTQVYFYLEDVLANQVVDLNVEDYVLDISTELNGTGRFYLNVVKEMRQEVAIPQGWFYYSSYMNSNVPISEVFSSIHNSIYYVKDFNGEIYFPSWNYDGIGEIKVDESYMIKSNQESFLEVFGDKVSPDSVAINLVSGWNFVPYLRDSPANFEDVFSELIENNNLIIAKDYHGGIWMPDYPIDNFDSLYPGQGYILKLNEPHEFYFLSNLDEY